MQASDIPVKLQIPFGNSAGGGFINVIPKDSQIAITPGAASLTDGFPPLTFLPVASGGIPPFGADFNGILYEISAWARWVSAGGPVKYDAAFSTAIGGYPMGAMLTSASGGSWWLSTANNNTTDPDAGGANWVWISPTISYAGNPNGNVAGLQGTAGLQSPTTVWDITHNVFWVCTTSGNAAAAVWVDVMGGARSYWCGVSIGAANVQVVTAPTNLVGLVAGAVIAWESGFSNTTATTLTIGALGTFAVLKVSPAGPVPLAGGELTTLGIAQARFDGTSLQLIATATGTAALHDASALTGVVAAVSGAVQVGHLAIFTDTAGTVSNGPLAGLQNQMFYIDHTQAISTPGGYLVDTSAGPLTVTIEGSPALGDNYTFMDALDTWNINNFTINPNGNSIMGGAANFSCDVAGMTVTFLFKAGNWSIQ